MKKRNLICLTVFLISIFCFAQKSKTLFATLDGEKIVFKQDSISFKNFISKNLFDSRDSISLDKIEIKKQNFLQQEKGYYFLLITDYKRNVKISRWLEKEKNNLYLTENFQNKSLFNETYFICIGEDDCAPNIFIMDKTKYWTCGTTISIICLSESEAKLEKCKVLKSVIFPD